MTNLCGNNLVIVEVRARGDFRESVAIVRVLLAEPDQRLRHELAVACGDLALTTACPDFQSARAHLIGAAPDVLITNLRLADYNGLHLVLLAKAARPTTRCIVHSDRPDVYLVREAQAAGAFFERTERLGHAITGYFRDRLPAADRRSADRYDRRGAFRGGRRAADQSVTV
jgi:DNA-binding NtrC family response regulator